jgi:superfamily II DNA or RNA helicase
VQTRRHLVDKYSLPNPARRQYDRRMARGLAVGEAPPERLSAVIDIPPPHPWSGGLSLPRACGEHVDEFEARVDGIPIDISLNAQLRPYQQQCLDAFLDAEQGVVQAPCGAGKTMIGLGAIAHLRRRTLIVVHTKDLQRQWIERLKTFTSIAQPGLVGSGRAAWDRPVVVALQQTLCRIPWADLYERGKNFGLVIIDEAHHIPAATFLHVLSALPARHRLGLTATPERDDGLTPFLHWSIGPMVARITREQLVASGHVLLPELHIVETKWIPRWEATSWTKNITALVDSPDRNRLLIKLIVDECREGRQVLVLSERVAHCERLAASIRELGFTSAALTAKSARAEILAEAEAKQLQVICATSLADEGLDLPRLDTVILATPTKALGRLEQRIGRVMRPAEGKSTPRVFDLVDRWGPLQGQWAGRRELYRRMGLS